MNSTFYVVKTKALISCKVTAQLICAFVFAYAKIRFSHDVAHIVIYLAIWALPPVQLRPTWAFAQTDQRLHCVFNK